ncbi:MAG TPA: hypothetical protein VF432_06830 [Thermoanaerobaculia bacterium]
MQEEEGPDVLQQKIQKSLKDRIASDHRRRQEEVDAVRKRFGKAMKELPAAIEAAGGPKVKALDAIGETVGHTSTAGFKKAYRDMADAHGPAIAKAFRALGLDSDDARDGLLKITGIQPHRWVRDRFLAGSTGLDVNDETGGK